MEIKAAVVFEKSGNFSVEKLQISDPNEDEVLVRIVGAGICHTDLVARDQHLPTPLPGVLGHEGSGVVEKVGARVTKVKPGDHVVLSYGSCGTCTSCKAGKNTCCLDFFLHNFKGSRPDGTTTLRKGDEVIHGCFVGGLLLGLVGSIVISIEPGLSLPAYYLLFMLLLLVKPAGILGK